MPNYYWVYILTCENNTYYTGYTNDLVRRYHAHVTGKSQCKYTRSFKPINIAQSWRVENKSIALKAEKHIKRLSKKQKTQLILNPKILEQLFKGVNHYSPEHKDE